MSLTDRLERISNPEVARRIEALELPWNAHGIDPYGVSKKHLKPFFSLLALLYRRYFTVRCHGIENVPRRGRAMLVGNHSGGIAVDGALVLTSMVLEMDPPRLAHGMAEKFLNVFPVASVWTSRVGQFTGLPEHAVRLLEDDRMLMVFPEGARGTAKLYRERHSLVGFGQGFMRLAMQTKTPIIPFACLGGGEAIPSIMNAVRLGKLMGVPYIPLTPYLLPLPLPVRFDIHYGEPMKFEGTGKEEDFTVDRNVAAVKAEIARLIEVGREARKSRVRKKLEEVGFADRRAEREGAENPKPEVTR